MLQSPVLAGLYPHRPRLADRSRGPVTIARDDSGEPVRVTDEPIISLADHRRILDALAARTTTRADGSKTGRAGAPKHPLSTLVECGSCGGALVYRSFRATFGCQRRNHNARACPAPTYVTAVHLEGAVARRVLIRLASLEPDSPELLEVASRWLHANRPTEDAERRAALDAVAEAEALVDDLAEARYARQEFPGPDGAKRWDRLYRPALARLEAARATLASFPEVLDVSALLEPELMAESLEAADRDGDVETRRDLYRLVLDRVTVAPGRGDVDSRVSIRWAGEEGV
jgi:hypothetical protein